MSGINHLKELQEKKGDAFLNGLLNNYVIISEKVNGAFFGIKKTKDDSFKYFKKNGEITYVDRVLMQYYNPAISFFESLPQPKRERIPSNFFFGFEYFNRGDHSNLVGRPLKNNLILSYIQKLDDSGNVIETLQSEEQLTKWANYLEVEQPPIIFEGRIDDEQRREMLDFVYSDESQLEEKFKTRSFTKHIVAILCPEKTVEFGDREIETLIFRFFGVDNNEEHSYLAKMVDPMFQKKKQEKGPVKNMSQDYIWLIAIDLMNHFEMYQPEELRAASQEGSNYDQKYINLINKIYKDFMKEYSVKYDGLELEVPEYLQRPEFALNIPLIGDSSVISLIKKSTVNAEIYKVLLNFFRKPRKRSSSGFFTPDLISQLNLIVQKVRNIVLGDAIYEGLFPSFSQFISSPDDKPLLSETEYASLEEKKEPTKVNIMVGQFQPITRGHLQAAEQLKNKNGKPVVLIAIHTNKKTKGTPISKKFLNVMLSKIQQANPEIIKDYRIVDSGLIDDVLKALAPDYSPILWGTSGRRLHDYAIQFDYIKKRNVPIRMSKDFNLVEMPSLVKSEEVLDAIRNSDFNEFKRLTPETIHSEFFNLQRELGVSTPVNESNDSRLKDKSFNKEELL
jgi:hypothetical protein